MRFLLLRLGRSPSQAPGPWLEKGAPHALVEALLEGSELPPAASVAVSVQLLHRTSDLVSVSFS